MFNSLTALELTVSSFLCKLSYNEIMLGMGAFELHMLVFGTSHVWDLHNFHYKNKVVQYGNLLGNCSYFI